MRNKFVSVDLLTKNSCDKKFFFLRWTDCAKRVLRFQAATHCACSKHHNQLYPNPQSTELSVSERSGCCTNLPTTSISIWEITLTTALERSNPDIVKSIQEGQTSQNVDLSLLGKLLISGDQSHG